MPTHGQYFAITSMLMLLAMAPIGNAHEGAPAAHAQRSVYGDSAYQRPQPEREEPAPFVQEGPAENIANAPAAMRPAFILPITFEAPEAEGEATLPLAPSEGASEGFLPLPQGERGQASTRKKRPGANINNILTTMASLGAVLGLFFVVTWLLRRTSPKNHQALPSEVVRVLGRAPQLGRFQLHLLQVGKKLLLVSSSTTDIQPLAEISDAAEVEQLLVLCQVNNPEGISASFRKVLSQLGQEKPSSKLAESDLQRDVESSSNQSTWGTHHA